jgi:hypothetical protein
VLHALLPNRRLLLGIAVVGCVAFTGCVSKSSAGNGNIYKFDWWLPTLVTLIGLGSLLLTVAFIAAQKGQNALIAGLVGLVMLLLGPPMFFAKAVVDDDHFELKSGMLFWGTSHNIKFSDMASITGVVEETRGRRGRKNTNFYAEIRLKSGGMEKVSVGDLMKNGAYTDLITKAAFKGIPVSGVGPENMD